MSVVGIVDYGVGNLRSVANAINHIGSQAIISNQAARLLSCDRLILPGVGAFPHGMSSLRSLGLDQVVCEASTAGIPVLGVCLGMQMLMESSTEFRKTAGLGLLAGEVRGFDQSMQVCEKHAKLRLPHVGWSGLEGVRQSEELAARVLRDLGPLDRFYFVHSFFAEATSPDVVAVSTYAGLPFASVVACANVIGTQFHPEKSGSAGLKLLKNFIS